MVDTDAIQDKVPDIPATPEASNRYVFTPYIADHDKVFMFEITKHDALNSDIGGN